MDLGPIDWNELAAVLLAGILTIAVAFKVMFDAKKEVEQMKKENSNSQIN